MRWERLFADLETQLEGAADGAMNSEIADRTRRELARTSMEGRLRAVAGRAVELSVAGVGSLAGEARRIGPGWLLLDVAGGPPALVATGAVLAAKDLPIAAREAEVDEAQAGDFGLSHVLQVLTRDRTVTSVVLADGTMLTGTIDRVGSDYFDLAEHPLDEPRRPSVVSGTRTLAFAAVAALRPRLD